MGDHSQKNTHTSRLLALTPLLLLALTCGAKILLSAGAPASLFDWLRVLSAGVAITLFVAARRAGLWMDGPRLLLVLLALWYLPDVYHLVGGDGIEYYVQARSILLDRDLDFANDYQGLGAPPFISVNGRIVSRMPLGVSVLWIPPLILTHLGATIASLFGARIPSDGFSPVYQSSVTIASFVYAFAGLLLLEALLRERYDRAVACLAVLGVWLATPVHFYMTANPSMSHSLSVFSATLFLWLWLRARHKTDPRLWFWVGLSGGLVLLVRVQDGVLLLLPTVDLMLERGTFASRARAAAALLVGPMLCGLVQLLSWRALYGPDFVQVIFAQSMIAERQPHVLDFLLSPQHGLLTWTPLYLGSLAGWTIWWKRSPRLAISFWVTFAAALAMNSSIGDWWASESFGQRRMLAWTPWFAWGLAEALALIRRQPMVLAGAVLTLLIFWNQQLAYIYNSELAGRRDQAVNLDRLAAAQVDVLYRKLLRLHDRIPRSIWLLLYDNIKGVWLFGGDRSLGGKIDLGNEPRDYYPLVGEGWFDPETEGGVTYRLSRGRRSWLTVPIRESGDFWISLRARRLRSEVPVRVELMVNGRSAGSRELSGEWSEYRFEVPREMIRAGLNQLTLVYSDTPRAVIPDFRGRNAAIAADWLQFTSQHRP